IFEYLDIFLPLGGSVFFLLIVIEILKEAIDITNGQGVNLGKKLILILFIGTILLNFNGLSKEIYSGAVSVGKEMVPRFEEVNNWINEGYERGVESQRASLELDKESGGSLTGFFLSIVLAILSGLGLLFIYLAMVLILVFIAGAYASLALTLVMGPVFIAMLLSPDLRGTGIKWVVILLSVFLTIPAYVMIMKITASLYSGSVDINNSTIDDPSSRSMSNTIESIGVMMVNPLLTFGLIFSVSKIVGSLTGSAGNIAEKTIGIVVSVVAATRMIVGRGVISLKDWVGSSSGSGKGGIQKGTDSSFHREKGKSSAGINGAIPEANPRENSFSNPVNVPQEGNSNKSIPRANPKENYSGGVNKQKDNK
ncbi:MAG: type IV secretion system protein, partial [Candidatus Aminicenantes bacterium]|nr:type IV secretion system protein [Candidatus Aminicenantes bacterium]